LRVNKPLDIKPGELRCPHCYGKDVVPSMPRGIWDALMNSLGRIPRHCRACGRRFHPKIEDVRRDIAMRLEAEKDSPTGDLGGTGF
jgi:hypothetical protein